MSSATPLQSRVDPFGRLFADSSRGLFMGNRGGRFHRDDRTIGKRRSVSRRWICCVLEFRGRKRTVWGDRYTELFFLDEPTALAAGHRPCFECRRQEAQNFAAFWADAVEASRPPGADDMDDVLHPERWPVEGKPRWRRPIDDLPDGAFVLLDGAGTPMAVRGRHLLPWHSHGYGEAQPRPRQRDVGLLTPLAIVDVLAAGYRPAWYSSAGSG